MKNFLTGLFLILTFAVHGEEIKQVPVVTIQTNLGPIEVELNPAKSPETVENFLTYAKNGFYEGTVFHRVIESFVVQGGGYTPDFKKKSTHDPIPNEAANGLKNVRGTVAMARTSEPHSASSQFFFNVKDNKFLDYKSQTPSGFGYCVFGKVVEGMEVVDKIAKLPTDSEGPFRRDVPQTPVVIEAVRIGYAPPTKWVMATPEKSPPPEKKKDKPEMPSMMEMQQDMLSDIDIGEEEKAEAKGKGSAKEETTPTAKTDSTTADKTATKSNVDETDAEESDASNQSEESPDAIIEANKVKQDKKGKSPEDQAPTKTAVATETDTDQTTSETAPVTDKVGKHPPTQSASASPKAEPKSAEHSAKDTESEPAVATKKVANDSNDSTQSKTKDSKESDKVTSEESGSEEEAIAPGSNGSSAAIDSEETEADEETKANKSPPASATPSTKAKPKESKPAEEENAKGEGEDEGEEKVTSNRELANLADKSAVTRSAMAVSNEMKRIAEEEEDKSTEKTAKVIPKLAVKTPPAGAKPPDLPTSPDKPEPPAN